MNSKIKKSIFAVFILIAINISNAQEAKVTYPSPPITPGINYIETRTRIEKPDSNRNSLIAKFKAERSKNKQGRRKSSKYYNPLKFVYYLLGI